MINASDREQAVKLINVALKSGARLWKACNELGISKRTFHRWKETDSEFIDKRTICERPEPANKLSKEEKQEILDIVHSEEYADLPPSQIVPILADKARTFYLNESVKSNWSTRQLERQINSFYYQRLLSSQDKDSVRNEIQTLEKGMDAKDIIRDPYVLEFLGLDQTPNLYEKDIEQGLINHLQNFLLELGRGFSFVARQKHITFDGEHYYIDLVFYNYILKCFVIIDLKVGKLTHQDIGQMQMYVNYYTRELMNEGDNLPIGIVLCADKSDSVVKYTLPEGNNQIYASKYKLYMPTEEELEKELAKEQELLEIEKRLEE